MQRHKEFWNETEPVGTALPVLEKAIEFFPGPSLEFGMGTFSTPLMTSLLKGTEFHSIENDPDWVKKIKDMHLHTDPNHHIHLVDKWGADSNVLLQFDDKMWSVIFIDHGSHYRWLEINRFMTKCDLMVIHDANAHEHGGVNPMGNTREKFLYSLEIPAPTTVGHPSPSTVVASMTHDINQYRWVDAQS